MDDYPTGNKELISSLGLIPHPEGGYFVETNRQELDSPLPHASHGAERPLATSIYYLLTPERPSGVIHMNKSVTYHVLHQGRAEYTLITPPRSATDTPKVEVKVIGPDASAGETRMLFVGSGVWKMSRLLPEDMERADSQQADRLGCLITEVVVPGFVWEDHQFLTRDGLEEMFAGVEDGQESIHLYGSHIKS